MTNKDVVIAIVQMEVKDGSKEDNLNKAKRLISKIERFEPNFIVLPELFDAGYDFKKYPELANEIDKHDTVKKLSEIAEELGSYIIGGVLEKYNDKYFDTAVVINPEGKLQYVYRKIHLFQEETKYFSHGNKIDVIDTKFGKIGVEICYEVRFPEISRIMAFKGAKIIFAPAAFPYPRVEHWKQMIIARALENQIFFVGVNRVGPGISKTYFGESMIVDPWGDIILGAGEFENALAVKINLDLVEHVRNIITSFKDKRLDVYKRYYNEL